MLQIGPLDVDQGPAPTAADDEPMEYDPKPLSIVEVAAFVTVLLSLAALIIVWSLR
jgi:hypothetical protein